MNLSSPPLGMNMNQFGGGGGGGPGQRPTSITQIGQVPGMHGGMGQLVGGGHTGQMGQMVAVHNGQMVHGGHPHPGPLNLSQAQLDELRRRQQQQHQQQQTQLQGPPPLLNTHHPPPLPMPMQHPGQAQYGLQAVRRVTSTPNMQGTVQQQQQQVMMRAPPQQARLSAGPEGFYPRPGSAGPGVQVGGGFPTPAQQYSQMHQAQGRPPSAASPAGAGEMGPPARPASAAAGPMGALPHHVHGHPGQHQQGTLPTGAILFSRPNNIGGPQPGQMVNGHGPPHGMVNGGPPPPPPPPPNGQLQHPPQQVQQNGQQPHPLAGPHVQHQMNGHHPGMNGPHLGMNGPQHPPQHPPQQQQQQQHPQQQQPGQPGQPQQHPQLNGGQPQLPPPQQQQQQQQQHPPPPIQTQQLQQSRPGSAAPSSAHTQVTTQAGSPERQTPAPGTGLPQQPQPQAQNVGTPQQAPANVGRGQLAFGHGAALARLVQFSGALAVSNPHLTADELRDSMNNRCTLRFWNDFMKEWFADGAVVRLQLWKDNQTAECKSFEITMPVIPRFFLATSQSGVRGMSLGLDDAIENPTTAHHAEIRTSAAQWVYRYVTGYTVILRGQIHARLSMAPPPPGASAQLAAAGAPIRIEEISFTSHRFDVLIDFEAIMPREMREHVPARETAPSTPAQASAQPNRPDVERWVASQSNQPWGIGPPSQPQTPQLANAGPGAPGGGAINSAVNGGGGGGGGAGWAAGGWERERFEPAKERWATGAWVPERPVNAFGIPQMTMRCLELAESVTLMDELVLYAKQHKIGAMDALKGYASAVVQLGIVPPPPPAPPSTGSDETLVEGSTTLGQAQGGVGGGGGGQYQGFAPGAFPHGFAPPFHPIPPPPPTQAQQGQQQQGPGQPGQTQGPGQPGSGQQTTGPGQPGPQQGQQQGPGQAGPSTPANAPPQSPALAAAAANANTSAAPSPRAAPKKRGPGGTAGGDGTPKMANASTGAAGGSGQGQVGGESPAPAAVAGTKRKGRESADVGEGGSSTTAPAAPVAQTKRTSRKKAKGNGS